MAKFALFTEQGGNYRGDKDFQGFFIGTQRAAENEAWEIAQDSCQCEGEYDEEEDDYLEAECDCCAWVVEVEDVVVAYDRNKERYYTQEELDLKAIKDKKDKHERLKREYEELDAKILEMLKKERELKEEIAKAKKEYNDAIGGK